MCTNSHIYIERNTYLEGNRNDWEVMTQMVLKRMQLETMSLRMIMLQGTIPLLLK